MHSSHSWWYFFPFRLQLWYSIKQYSPKNCSILFGLGILKWYIVSDPSLKFLCGMANHNNVYTYLHRKFKLYALKSEWARLSATIADKFPICVFHDHWLLARAIWNIRKYFIHYFWLNSRAVSLSSSRQINIMY